MEELSAPVSAAKAPFAWPSAMPGPVSLLRAPISWLKRSCAPSTMFLRAACVMSSRVVTLAFVSIIDVSRVCSWRSEIVSPVLYPRLLPISARRPVESSFCASSSFDCILMTETRVASEIDLVDMKVVFMPSAHRRQKRVEHLVDGGDQLGRRLVGSLQLQ